MIAILRSIEKGCAWFGRIAAWSIPLLVASVCLSVLLVQLRANELADWGYTLPLLGSRLTLNGLNDLQWHLFAVMVMLGGVYALHDDRHVCVDFASSHFPARTAKLVTLACDLMLLLPFAVVMTWFAWQYMAAAYASGEASPYGGLSDRWIVKAVMPLGFGLLVVYALSRALRLGIELATGRDSQAARD